MRLEIRYRVHFRYTEEVSESQNEVRMRPRDDDHQSVMSYRLTSNPPTRVLHAHDYWGTAVDHLGVRALHRELELVADATVGTSARPSPVADAAISALADPEFRSEHYEFLEPSEHVMWQAGDALARRAAAACASAASVPALVLAVADEARRTLAYERGSTEIGVSLEDLLAGGAGVCQDFAHLAIGMLRSVGVPTRYVSGYLFAADETIPTDGGLIPAAGVDEATAAAEPQTVRVQTHAWIEAALPGSGWWALDPTNGGPAGERHVVIGCGRDYGDVPPVRGTFTGGATAKVDAEVLMGTSVPDEAAPSKRSRSPYIAVRGAAVDRAGQQQ